MLTVTVGGFCSENLWRSTRNANYPNIFHCLDSKKQLSFTSTGLGPVYGKNRGKACFYLPLGCFSGFRCQNLKVPVLLSLEIAQLAKMLRQTTTKIGPHGRGINYSGGWLPTPLRMDDQKWHTFELIKGTAGTALVVDGKRTKTEKT